MINTIIWKNFSDNEKNKILARPIKIMGKEFNKKVRNIIREVRAKGDFALKNMTKKFDEIEISEIKVSNTEIENSINHIKESTINAIKKAIVQLKAFHIPQKPRNLCIENHPGIRCETILKPIQRVGLYIPGGSAPLISTVMMLGVPAQIADCPTRILCSPPNKQGEIDPHILYVAKLCGINEIYKIGGAQAIAAMAYGTETVPKVDKVFGPGNSWVTQAKIYVSQDSAGAVYDLPAGPSEVMIIADKYANAEFIAADLLSQAEHGKDSQAILICMDINFANEVNQAISRQIKFLSRQKIIAQALENSFFIIVDTVLEAINIANDYAPEHLIIQVMESRSYVENIQSAGSVFLGAWSPESAGDYASGTNHVLPTDGFAKSLSGLSVRDFFKSITVQELTRDGLFDIADTIRELAYAEGLDAHLKAVDIRFMQGGCSEK